MVMVNKEEEIKVGGTKGGGGVTIDRIAKQESNHKTGGREAPIRCSSSAIKSRKYCAVENAVEEENIPGAPGAGRVSNPST